MRIILFEIFGIQIKSYGLMIAIGIIVAAALFINKGKKKGFNEDHLLNLIIFAVIGGIIGGKGLFIITEIADIIKDPKVLLDFGLWFCNLWRNRWWSTSYIFILQKKELGYN